MHMTIRALRPCWLNCYGAEDRSFLFDGELLAIDAMEDAIAPLDEQATRIRQVMTGFEACYHEADKEAEFIIGAIGAGHCPQRSNERPAQRKRDLENARDILAAWCAKPSRKSVDREIGGVRANELLGFIGEPNPLKLWQVARILDKVRSALEPDRPYQNLVLGVGEYGEPGECTAEAHYQNDLPLLRRTRETMIHDTADGKPSRVSLAYAIDLLMPCGWDFSGSLATILKAIGGDLHPTRPLACCARNIRLSPLYDRLTTISNTLNAFWKGRTAGRDTDPHILASLGTPTLAKRWLAASLDKTIRLHLTLPFNMNLF